MRAVCRIPGVKSNSKPLTGCDAPVIEYLNQHDSVHQYLANVKSLVDATVHNYRNRRISQPDGFVRMHRRPASFGISCQSSGGPSARRQGPGSRSCTTSSWRRCCDEGHGARRRLGHAPASAHQRSPQGPGRNRRTDDARDHALPAARVWHPRRNYQRASLRRHADRLSRTPIRISA